MIATDGERLQEPLSLNEHGCGAYCLVMECIFFFWAHHLFYVVCGSKSSAFTSHFLLKSVVKLHIVFAFDDVERLQAFFVCFCEQTTCRQRGNHNTMWPKMSLSPTDVKKQLTSIL